MKKMITILMMIAMLAFVGCQKAEEAPVEEAPAATEEQATEEVSEKSTFDTALEEAKGTTVTFYGWGGSQRVNEWLDNSVATYVKENHDITLERVPMNIDEILNKLLGEKQLNAEGTIDIVWINGENFSTAKTNDLLFGPFTTELPNFNTYIDGESLEANFDFGFAIEGYEAPYGKAQFVLIADGELEDFPKNADDLMRMAQENPGKLTYPALPDFVGSAFVRNVIYDVVGYENVKDLPADKEAVREAIKPALAYLVALKPYLWMEGETYPATSALLDNMYSDGEIMMTMSYNPNHVAGKISTGEFTKTSKAFVFDKGSIGNTHYLAIPGNATNKEAAMVVINAILSPELQASKYNPDVWGDLPVLDNSTLSEDEKALFTSVPLGEGVLPQSVLLEKRLPELPVHLIPIIEEIWMETVPGE